MKRCLFIIFFLLSATILWSQTGPVSTLRQKKVSRIGVQLGLNFPSQVFTTITEESELPDLKNPARFTAGFYSESGTYEYFVTQFGVFYSSAGFKTKDGSVNLDYLQLPVILNFRTPIIEPVFLQAGLGPYFGFAFNGVERSGTSINRDILSLPSTNLSESKPYGFFDGGLVFRGSVEWVLPSRQILTLGVSYHLGVFKVSNKYLAQDEPPVEINTGAKNRIFAINLSYLLDLTK